MLSPPVLLLSEVPVARRRRKGGITDAQRNIAVAKDTWRYKTDEKDLPGASVPTYYTL